MSMATFDYSLSTDRSPPFSRDCPFANTFHEVKSKHTKRKEKINSQALEESGQKPVNQGRGCGSGKGNSSPYISHDVAHGMNTAILMDNGVVPRITAFRRENGVEADAKVLPHVAKSPFVSDTVVGSKKVPHSSATAGERVQQSSVASFPNLPKYDTYAAAVMSRSSLPQPKANVDHEHSASDLASVPSCASKLSIMVGTIECYVESHWVAAVDPNKGLGYFNKSESNRNSNHPTDPLDDETNDVPSSINQETLSTGEEGSYFNKPQALPSECRLSNKDQLKHEKLPTVAPSYPVVEPTPIPGSPLFRLEGLNSQAWISSPSSSPNPSSTGNSPAVPTVAPIPPPTQSAVAQSSIDVPSLPPVFWEPYPRTYIPGSHYDAPFNVLPALDQPFVYSGFPQQLSTGSIFLPTPVTAMGTQIPSAPCNMGTITGDQSHEDAAVWTPTVASQEITWLPVNSSFNLLPQGQHLSMGPQSGHGAFLTVYHPLHTVAATKAIDNPLLQQYQCMAASSVLAGPPPSNISSRGNANKYHHHYHHHHHHYHHHRHYHYGNKAYNHGSGNNDRHH